MHYPSQKDSELRRLALDLADNKIFTSLQVSEHEAHLLPVIFLPLALGALRAIPVAAKCVDDTGSETFNAGMIRLLVGNMVEWCLEERFEIQYDDSHIQEIGMIFEYYDKAGPRSINGFPCFFSFQILNRTDTQKVLAMAQPLMDMKEEFLKGTIEGEDE
jgi:hypothetical protein